MQAKCIILQVKYKKKNHNKYVSGKFKTKENVKYTHIYIYVNRVN